MSEGSVGTAATALELGRARRPPVEAPARKGFGHMVIDRMLTLPIEWKVTMDFAPDGLSWSAWIPSTNLITYPADLSLRRSP